MIIHMTYGPPASLDAVELRDLRYFLACRDQRSLTRAATRLHIAQPTLSHAIARLEHQVGEALLRRGTAQHSLQLTDAGRDLAASATRMLDELQHFARRRHPEHPGDLRGRLRLASIQSLNLTLLPEILAGLAHRHPELEIQVDTYPAPDLPQVMREQRAELGLLAAAEHWTAARLQQVALYRERFIVVARQDDALATQRRLTLAQAAKRDLVLPPADGFTGGIIHAAFAEAGLQPRVRCELASGEALRALVRVGLGIAILPERYLARDDGGLRSIDLVRPVLRRQVVALLPGDSTPDRLQAAVLAALRQARADDPSS